MLPYHCSSAEALRDDQLRGDEGAQEDIGRNVVLRETQPVPLNESPLSAPSVCFHAIKLRMKLIGAES